MAAFISNAFTPKPTAMMRVMAFIDGGYLEHNLNTLFKSRSVDFSALTTRLLTHMPLNFNISYYLIRIYYYDAIYADKPISDQQKQKHEQIKNTDFIELRLGRIKDDGDGRPKQKGVDTLIAIDMVSKAYENQYDVAVLLAGDDDFLDVVKAVKNAGKQVYGFFFEKTVSADLKDFFDTRSAIDATFATQIRYPKRVH